jgi:hypothetical protein
MPWQPRGTRKFRSVIQSDVSNCTNRGKFQKSSIIHRLALSPSRCNREMPAVRCGGSEEQNVLSFYFPKCMRVTSQVDVHELRSLLQSLRGKQSLASAAQVQVRRWAPPLRSSCWTGWWFNESSRKVS